LEEGIMSTCLRSILVLCVAIVALSSLKLLPSSVGQSAASSYVNQTLTLSSTRGTVGSLVSVTLTHFPPDRMVQIWWDGQSVGSVHVNDLGVGAMSLKVPAATKGVHTVTAASGNTTLASKPFEVVPRIKLIPGMVGWGEPVNVSLRGYAPWTVVRIRWLRGSTWIEVARVSTSKTGSANIDVIVPSWAPLGANSVRGDAVTADGGRAQTNAFRADRLISVVDPVETLRPIEGTPVRSSPTPTPTVEPAIEPSVSPTNTPTVAPTSTPIATPIAQISS
jgi:hypothetical protein